MKKNDPRIMILGAGVYQVPLIRQAQKMGLETVVISPKGNYPGIPLADIFLDLDTTDSENVVSMAKKFKISGIVTTGTDVCIPSLGLVVDTLGLPGTGYEAAKRCMDKTLMKKKFVEHAITTADFEVFYEQRKAMLFANQVQFPVMVKAPDSSGSRGVTKVNSEREFQFAWNRAKKVSRTGQVIVEKFLVGVEFGAQAFVHDNRVIKIFPHGDLVTPAPFFSPIGHYVPSQLTPEQLMKTKLVIERAVSALDIRDCISNVDLMLVENEPTIIEIGARMGATCLPENISLYSGSNVYEHLIRLAMGDHPVFNVNAKQPNASLLLMSDLTGIVSDIEIPDEVKNHPDLVDLHWDIEVGDSVRAFEVGPDRIGHIIVKKSNVNLAKNFVQSLAKKIKITIQCH